MELSDAALKNRVELTMAEMFGYLNDGVGAAVVLGEFGGLYTKDAHPKRTIQRTVQYTMETMLENNYAGGYVWSLNPESGYEYNPASQKHIRSGTGSGLEEGVLLEDWIHANMPYLNALKVMDKIKDLKPIPCFST